MIGPYERELNFLSIRTKYVFKLQSYVVISILAALKSQILKKIFFFDHLQWI